MMDENAKAPLAIPVVQDEEVLGELRSVTDVLRSVANTRVGKWLGWHSLRSNSKDRKQRDAPGAATNGEQACCQS